MRALGYCSTAASNAFCDRAAREKWQTTAFDADQTQCRRWVKLGRASPSQTCPLLPQLQKSGTTSPPIFEGLRTERVVRLTSDGVEALDHFSTICKVHILFDHLIECVVRRSGGPPIAEVRGNRNEPPARPAVQRADSAGSTGFHRDTVRDRTCQSAPAARAAEW